VNQIHQTFLCPKSSMMNKILLLAVIGWLSVQWATAQNQDIIKHEFEFKPGSKLDLDLKFAEMIKVEVWDKAEVSFQAVLRFQDPEIKKVHQLNIDEDSGMLSIHSDFDYDAYKPTNGDCFSENLHMHYSRIYCLYVDYELKIPKNADVRMETISGNIEIVGLEGSLRAKSISGFVDVALPKKHQTSLSFRSVTGEIYTDFNIELDKGSNAYSKKLSADINGGGDRFSLETISGDIYFRKL